MKMQIRRSVFETNSSSVHSLTIVTKSEFEEWKNGNKFFDQYKDKFVDVNDETQNQYKNDEEKWDKSLYTYDQYYDWDYIQFEKFTRNFVTPSGDEMVAFGYFGRDG